LCAQQTVIEKIEFVGNRRFQRDMLRARIFSRPGDAYNEEALQRDFQALWNTQFFEDIRLEVEDSPERPNAKIVVFYVQERPVIRRIEYEGLKSVTVSEVLERYKERRVSLTPESPFDPTRIKRAEVVLKELLGERGRQYAVIRPTFERIPATNAVRLVFVIEEGPKVKVGKITIDGNTAFSERRVVRSMRHSRPYAIPLGLFDWSLPIASKTYDRRKLNEELEIGVRGLYQDHGYFQVLVKDPEIETVDVNRGGLPGPWPFIGRKRGKRTNITIPLDEGDQFRMGKLFVRSSDPEKGLFFKPEFLQSIFPLQEGDIFATNKIRESFETYKKLYGEWGFIDFTSQPGTDVDVASKRIDLTLEFDEQKQYSVRRIEFSGNTTTRDKVIRREVLLDEGDLFNTRFWEISILRLNQLEFFEELKAERDAEVKRNIREGTVDILLKVKEKGKQSVGLTGGVSGIAGTFIGLSYQTNNFLGLGETLTFSADWGDRQRNFLFGFTEPYLFDRPISAGFTLFSSRFSFDESRETSLLLGQRVQLDPAAAQNFDQNRKGFTVFASYPLRRFAFTRLGLTYSYTASNVSTFSEASRLIFEALQFRGFAGPSALRGIRSSRLSPTISYNTVGPNPLHPTQGKSFFYAAGFEGGPIGGNVNTTTHTFEGKYFRPLRKKQEKPHVLGFRLLTAFATGYGGRVLPPFNRFVLGGEDTVRGFDFYTISPWTFIPTEGTVQAFYQDPTKLDFAGNPQFQFVNVPLVTFFPSRPGGDSQAVGNIEYRIPIVGPVTLGIFLDVGLNGALRRNQLQMDPTGIARLRAQFPDADIRNPLPLVNGTNFKLRSSMGLEFVVQLPIVNAPFRIYWAYNLHRLNRVIATPRGAFALTDEFRQSLPPGVFEAQLAPQLNRLLDQRSVQLRFFEPLRTIRFTVSRTF
jgi:outer membrane protein insertion porin family